MRSLRSCDTRTAVAGLTAAYYALASVMIGTISWRRRLCSAAAWRRLCSTPAAAVHHPAPVRSGKVRCGAVQCTEVQCREVQCGGVWSGAVCWHCAQRGGSSVVQTVTGGQRRPTQPGKERRRPPLLLTALQHTATLLTKQHIDHMRPSANGNHQKPHA